MEDLTRPIFTFIHAPDAHLSESFDALTPFITSVHQEQYHPCPDFIVFGGDNINGSRDDGRVCEREMPILKEKLGTLKVPYHILCHNHDTWGEACRGEQYRLHFDNPFNYSTHLSEDFVGIFMSGMYVDGDVSIKNAMDNALWLDQTLGNIVDQKVLMFSHVPLFPPRKPVLSHVLPTLKREGWEASRFGLQAEISKPFRDVIAKHGHVVAHYSGHCHVHSVTESRGTHYVTTASMASQPWEYRYIEVYADRIVHRCICPHPLRKGEGFWTNCLNEDHPDVDIYHDGLSQERDFGITY
ncbi:MAG: hypothetical protein ACI8V2_003794 [Candidatus Latescibacterota bacterium]|jgi:hypothetical protein